MIQNINIFTSLHPPGDTPSDHIRRGVFYEESIFNKFLPHITGSGIFLDIGANIGNHAVMFSQYCPNSTIYCFEANPFNYVHLANNVKSLSNVSAICTALSNEMEVVEFVHFPPSPGSSRLRKYFGADVDRTKQHDYMYGTHIDECIKINVIAQALDTFDFKNVQFIKLDVEGHEKFVMQGAQTLLKSYKPVIWIEDFVYQDVSSATQYLINEFGYEIVDQDQDCNILLK